MTKKRSGNWRCSGERGLTLIEVLVALGILTAVGATFMIGLTVTSKASLVSQERVNTESLAKSQMERIKSWQYDSDNNPPQYGDAKLPPEDFPAGYDITITAIRLDPKGDGTGNDDGIQKITVTVTLNGEAIFTLDDYKGRQGEG
jgi:prepilin-type N-terminal cleavage/methylation domain-containing protein